MWWYKITIVPRPVIIVKLLQVNCFLNFLIFFDCLQINIENGRDEAVAEIIEMIQSVGDEELVLPDVLEVDSV